MIKKIETQQAPKAIGPYSQAIVVPAKESLCFVSGQLPIDPNTQEMIKGDIGALTRLVLDNIEAILLACGSSLEQVVRTDVFLKDIQKDFQGMNEEYSRRFSTQNPPARQTIQAAELPKGSPIEISCIAVVKS